MKRLLIFQDKKPKTTNSNLDLIIDDLESRLEYMYRLSIEEIIDFFDQLVNYWQNDKFWKRHPYLRNLIDFFSRENLVNTLTIALHGNYKALDEFVDLGDYKSLLKAHPRGLTVHWLAGNVPALGLFSIFSALVTKNVCLVKAPSRGYEQLVDLLNTLNKIKTNKINGAEFTQSIAMVLIDRDDKKRQQKISLAADVRVAWGGKEAIETIMDLKKQLFCEDIILGPKYSYAVIDKQSLNTMGQKLAQRLAIDISVFDQYACSSPHTVFIEEKKPGQALKFAKELAKQLEFIRRTLLPKGKIDPAKAAEIISLRSEYELRGKVFSSSGTEWTVIYSPTEGLAKGCFSRVVFVKPIDKLRKLGDYNDRQKQTLGLGFTKENKRKYINSITRKGIDRCPNLGYLTFYESPWDGMFIFDRLVRWVSLHKDEQDKTIKTSFIPSRK
ncbi:hypothetical protein A2160_02590 [Candidatus Beckwithbacteria bacterium RBG_13_42_9]|uniref:Long-chain-fatty-acyl-CoA reductase n=1 Tax=Candidatus Beckwithbacteria bacterium RBG_13_42_9 TaxID=1797457 RepID=A0A1F5E7H6_9BACT|nr:MAG: hypothetical protein A2160_02590 [Candidatus Beckwithbacteria bacterium RBG_13_42_9]